MARVSFPQLLVFSAGIAALVFSLAGCPPESNPDLPSANFLAAPTEGIVPLTVQFTDTSLQGSSPIRSWFWDFGDGTYATNPNPAHEYTAAGLYTVKLTVESVRGADTEVRQDCVRVYQQSAFAIIGPEGGDVATGDASVVVPPNARETDTAVGLTVQSGTFTVNIPETVYILSKPIVIAHDGEDLNFLGGEGGDSAVPTVITLPFLAGSVPVADLNGTKIHVVAKLQDGNAVPLFGEVTGSAISVEVAGLPQSATYGVIYRPEATTALFNFTETETKAETPATWTQLWRLRLSPILLQQLTALRLGDIENTAAYARRDFSQAATGDTLDAIEAFLEELTGDYENAEFRSPRLLAPGGAYELAFYNFAGGYDPTYTRFADLTAASRLFGTIVIDPRQLLNVSLHNANAAAENPDMAQEYAFENAFAGQLYAAVFEGYDYPALTADSEEDGGAVDFAQGLKDGAAAFLGQRADGFENARLFDATEVASLSYSLFAPFAAAGPGYAVAAQDFFTFLGNAYDLSITAFLGDASMGLLERLRFALVTAPGALNFARASQELLLAANDIANLFYSRSLASLYWQFARELAYEGSALAQLRPSDAERTPFSLQEDRFATRDVVSAEFEEDSDVLTLDSAKISALADIPPLSSRAVVITVDPETKNVLFSFNRDKWAVDLQGNSVAVKVYPEGQDGIELADDASELTLNEYVEPCALPDDNAVLVPVFWFVFDGNGDGGLSLAEVQALDPAVTEFAFSLLDTDHSGLLSLNEVLVALPSLSIDLLGILDTNGDQFIDRAELGVFVTEEQFNALDINGNDYIDCGDLPPTKQAKADDVTEPDEVIVLISNLNLTAANSIYMNVVRPTTEP